MDSAPLDPPVHAGRDAADRAANNIGMPIARVEVFLLDFPLPHRRSFSTGGGETRGASLVRIEDADGAVGWGETYPLPAGTARLAALGRLLVGRDPSAAIANQALLEG